MPEKQVGDFQFDIKDPKDRQDFLEEMFADIAYIEMNEKGGAKVTPRTHEGALKLAQRLAALLSDGAAVGFRRERKGV